MLFLTAFLHFYTISSLPLLLFFTSAGNLWIFKLSALLWAFSFPHSFIPILRYSYVGFLVFALLFWVDAHFCFFFFGCIVLFLFFFSFCLFFISVIAAVCHFRGQTKPMTVNTIFILNFPFLVLFFFLSFSCFLSFCWTFFKPNGDSI